MGVPEAMAGISFQHLYSEQVVFAVRPGHPLLDKEDFQLNEITGFTVLYPPEESITGPTVDRFLLAEGVSNIRDRIDTVSDSFGKEFIRHTDAIWIISRGVVAREIADGELAELPVNTKETLSAVGLSVRADTNASMALQLFSKAVTETAAKLDSYYNPAH
jgi:LysR family pca operon transcriptional activator